MHGDMDCFYIQGGGVLRQAGELLFLVFEVSHATIIVGAIDLFVVRNRSARCEEKEKLESVNQGKFGYSKKEDLELPLFFICLLIRQKPNTIRYREQQAIKVYKYFEFRKIWVQQEGNWEKR